MNFEDISKKLKKFSKDTAAEVQKLNEVRQLNSRINDEKKKLNTIYMEMGKKLYSRYKEEPLEGFEDEMRTIEEKFSMIDLLQAQIRTVKGVVLCPRCNAEVSVQERFCPNCGSKMPEVISISEEEAEVLEGEVVETSESETAESETSGEEKPSEGKTSEAEVSEKTQISAEDEKSEEKTDSENQAEAARKEAGAPAEMMQEDSAEDDRAAEEAAAEAEE